MKDKLGFEINIGDKVIYTLGHRSYTGLEEGIVKEIINDREVKIYSLNSKRILANTRYASQIISIVPHQTVSPELFI